MVIRFLLFLFLIFAHHRTAVAEYRVFLLKISKKGNSQGPALQNSTEASANPPQPSPTSPTQAQLTPQQDKFIESTLDPEQYLAYHPLASDETISYTETWRCYGRTGGEKPHCPNPKRQPASSTDTSPATNSQNPTPQIASPP